MSDKAIITIKSTTSMDKNDVIEVITPGTIEQNGEIIKVQYDETKISGMEGTKTTLLINKDSFKLLREGSTETIMEFILNKSHVSLYKTPYGIIEIEITTQKLNIDIEHDYILIKVIYLMNLEDQGEIKTNLMVHIKK